MARILALDTTGEFGSLALLEDNRLVEESLLHSPDGFGHILFPHLERMLSQHGWNLSEIDCYAAAAGPGSFTGVRVGLAAVKGLAESMGKPVAAVSNLAALAWHGTAPLRAVFADARRGQVYGAVYNSSLEAVLPESVAAFPAWLATLPPGEVQFIAANLAPFQASIAASRFASAPMLQAPRALAAAIAHIAHGRYRQGQARDPAAIDANYVRRSDAELFWSEPSHTPANPNDK
jgi:tRNA threonylcarbamoyladenosine biosynthesis protein TsaB